MITIFAPDGIGEVAPNTDLAAVVLDAVRADPAGPLADGDIVVITSKIISKAEGRAPWPPRTGRPRSGPRPPARWRAGARPRSSAPGGV